MVVENAVVLGEVIQRDCRRGLEVCHHLCRRPDSRFYPCQRSIEQGWDSLRDETDEKARNIWHCHPRPDCALEEATCQTWEICSIPLCWPIQSQALLCHPIIVA